MFKDIGASIFKFKQKKINEVKHHLKWLNWFKITQTFKIDT